MLPLVDAKRRIAAPHGGAADDIPRRLPTVVWFPRVPAGTSAPSLGFPLIVFAHGFDLTPTTYRLLLRSWARAGYVVAAPRFPRTSPGAVGGLDESDIVNQPGDVRFVIGRLLRANRSPASPLHALIDPAEVAVAGHSDGGETAFAVAFDACCRDPRIRAAIVMSGAELTLGGGLSKMRAPPVLVVQGTADTINSPWNSTRVFDVATGPKDYLRLKGAEHLPPYSEPGPYERVVSRVSLDFLNAYLKHLNGARAKLMIDGKATPRLASMESGR
jgi:predicted dienelactone hydrolase